jgi:hypothetical protein
MFNATVLTVPTYYVLLVAIVALSTWLSDEIAYNVSIHKIIEGQSSQPTYNCYQ